MYTRVYQGSRHDLPEDYHGTAFREEKANAAKEEDVQNPSGGAESVMGIPQKQQEEEMSEEAFRPVEEVKERKEFPKGTENAWQAELLLLTLCALLIESEEPDTRLLALLLLLFLSPNT